MHRIGLCCVLLALFVGAAVDANGQVSITPVFSVRPLTLPSGQASDVLLTVRNATTGTLTASPTADQFAFVFDQVGKGVAVIAVDSAVTLHIGPASPLTSNDFVVTTSGIPANQVTVHYAGGTPKTWSAGETVSIRATVSPLSVDGFGADVGYSSALQAANPAIGDTLAFVTFAAAPKNCSLDVDGNGAQDALTDGLILMRALFGLTGAAVTNGAIGSGSTRTTWNQISTWLNANCGANFPL